MKILWTLKGNEGFVADIVSATLTDPTASFGVRSLLDPEYPIVPPNTPLIEEAPGIFSYEFSGEPNTQYEYYIKVVEDANIYYVYGIVEDTPGLDTTTLYGVRKLLVDSSGRVDLVRDAAAGDYTDMGLGNFYINQAQRWLDRQLDNHSSKTRLYKELLAGESVIQFSHVRYVTDVFEVTENNKHIRLKWVPINPNEAPDSNKDKSWQHAIHVKSSSRNRMILIRAAWYNPTLVNDSDRSWWTVNHPLILVHATMRELEISMRNTQGVNDFEEPLIRDCKKIYDDLVAESMAGTTEHWRMQ